MAQEHPINPPPELVRQWTTDATFSKMADQRYIAIYAACWGADQELDACCEWFRVKGYHPEVYRDLRTARRPKPPSLKAQALGALAHLENGAQHSMDTTESAHYIRLALESLPE